MGHPDYQNVFSNKQSIVGVAGTPILSTRIIDLGTPGTVPFLGGSPTLDPGRGEEIEIEVKVTTTVTSGGACDVTTRLLASAATDLGTPTVLWTSGLIAKATLVAGYAFRIRCIPPGGALKYLGLDYTPSTSDTTAGKIWAAITSCAHTSPGSFS